MQLTCPFCEHIVEYSTERPRFCSHCGHSLSTIQETVEPSTLTRVPKIEDATIVKLESQGPAGRAYVAGDRIGGYRLVRRIGAGAMGSVFEAEELDTNRRVAVKLIAPEYAMSSAAVERFRLEGRLASTIAHSRCVFVLAAEEHEGQPYIVMELMTGATLTSLVAERGPLAPIDAIRRILDVIDGLQEAHRLGVIHRDVKPSNCFIDARGRVKIGDFGLAKSVQEDGELTSTGAFVGTVLFASPEQIKRQPLDVQSDVYSVCATLYYLLTGKAPFSAGDALAAATRLVTEDAPSMRTLRPELNKALDRAVLRGLERDKNRRWTDLEALRLALIRFLPGQLSIGGLGSRFVAHLCDVVVLWILSVAVGLFWTSGLTAAQTTLDLGLFFRASLIDLVVRLFLSLVYYGVLEGVWGWSLGKLLLRLRVCRADSLEPPCVGRAILRALVFFNLISIGYWLALFLFGLGWLVDSGDEPSQGLSLVIVGLASLAQVFGFLLGLALICIPMRTRGGYRGAHEFASQTRVLELSYRRRRGARFEKIPFEIKMTTPEDMPRRLGRFDVQGAVRWLDSDRTLYGEDPALHRAVWIVLRRESDAPPPILREVSRPGRLRWVAGGQQDEWTWNAYLAPSGAPLPAVMDKVKRLPWADAAPILDQLAEELTAACEDGSVPEVMSAHQIWVDAGGRIQLVGTPLAGTATTVTGAAVKRDAGQTSPEARSLALIREAAVWTLEGQSRSTDAPRRICAPIPRFAGDCLNRLYPGLRAYGSPREFRGELRVAMDRPGEVGTVRRFAHLAVLALLMLISIGWLLAAGSLTPIVMEVFPQVAAQTNLADLEAAMNRDLAVALVQPEPTMQLAGIAQYEGDLKLRGALKRKLDHDGLRRRERLDTSSFIIRNQLKFPDQSIHFGSNWQQQNPRLMAKVWAESDNKIEQGLGVFLWFCYLAGPLVWIVWAFIARGGFGLRLLGLELIQRDGRPASRWRCLLRAILFWAPLIALWSISLALDRTFWLNWSDFEFRQANRWMPHVSWICWWTALVALISYFIYALWKPERSLHDRLAGTWLMPR